MKRKFKTKRDVHIRSGAPRRGEDNTVGFFQAGRVLTLEVEPVDDEECEMIAGNNTWYRIGGDLYVWDGDLEFVGEEEFAPSFTGRVNYGKILKIPESLIGNKGAGIQVGIMDTGVYQKHPDFEGYFTNPVIPSENFTESPAGFEDKFGHGTHVAGLIGARNEDDVGVTGIAPGCELFNFKVLSDSNTSSKTSTKRALMQIKESGISPSVFNLSFSLFKVRFEQIKKEFQDVLDLHHLMVAAAGNDSDLLKDKLKYPANHPGIISVGSISKHFEKGSAPFSSNLDYIIPSNQLVVPSIKEKGFYDRDGFSSMASALMSGIVCLIVKAHGFVSKEKLKEIIDELADEYRDEIAYDQPQILKP